MRIVALISGSGTNLQAVLDAVARGHLPLDIAAVGADVPGVQGLARAEAAGVRTFTVSPKDHADREAWNVALADAVAAHDPDLVVCSGFMRILGKDFLDRFAGRIVNTHPALLPSFPGAHGVRDALAYGVKVTGCTVHWVDAGVDTGRIIAQAAVPVLDTDTEQELHERIKVQERALLVRTLGEFAARHAEGDTVSA